MRFRMRYGLTIACLLGLIWSVELTKTAQAESSRPNVLFLICDDLNCDLGSYGHSQVQSPNIDRLARQGMRFEQAYCQYPLCGPSRASFLTGLYPDQTLIHTNAIYVRERIPNVLTLPQHFKENGYFSSRIGKLYHYGVPRNIGTSGHDDPESWNYTVNPRGRDVDDEADIFTLQKGQFGGTLSWLAAEGTDAEQTDGIAAREAAEQLKKFAASETPFFLAVGLYRPHTPYVAPKKYFDLYPLNEIVVPEVPDGYLKTLPASAVKTLTRKKDQVDLPDELARQAIQAYYASITFADAQLGLILDALEQTGLDKNTIILFTSDHGYHMGEHGHYQKTTLFENAARVPLIVSYPDMPTAGQTSRGMAEMVDFYPTLTELCGLKTPKHISGMSLVPALQGKSENLRTSALTQLESGYSLRTDRYRVTAWGENGSAGLELYDREQDPQELHNLADSAEHAQILAELRTQLEDRIAAANRRPVGVTQRLPGKRVGE